MDAIATLLAVVGPLMAAVGAGMLAYDAFRGPARWYQQVHSVRGSLRLARENRDAVKRGYERYPPEEAEKAYREADEKYERRVAEIEEETAADDLEERFHSQKLALKGFLLVAVGSLMQAASALKAGMDAISAALKALLGIG